MTLRVGFFFFFSLEKKSLFIHTVGLSVAENPSVRVVSKGQPRPRAFVLHGQSSEEMPEHSLQTL